MSEAPENPTPRAKQSRWGNSRLGRWIARHEFVANVLTLMTGTAFAQVVGMILMLLLPLFYTDAQVGALGTFMAVVGFVVTIAALRYDLAIVPAATDDDARALISLATRINFTISALTTLVLAIFGGYLGDTVFASPGKLKDGSDPIPIGGWIWLAGPLVFITAQVTILGYWLTRKKLYRLASTNQMVQSLGLSTTRIGFGALGLGVSGLIGSQYIGVTAALLRVYLKTRDELTGPLKSSRRKLARRFVRYPLLNGPNALVDAIRLSGITLLINRFFNQDTTGNFFFAWTLIQAPLSLINGALSQVFFQKLAITPRGEMFRVVKQSLLRSALLGIVPFGLIFFLAPIVWPWLMGGKYPLVGEIAAVLVPWLFLNLATSPVSMLFVVVQKQGVLLAFGVAYMATPLSILWFYHPGIIETMTAISLAMAGLLVIFCILALWAARAYDAGRTPDISVD